jgi:flagellar biogenesis protein FliO
MRVFLTLALAVFSLQAGAYSFTQEMSTKHSPQVEKATQKAKQTTNQDENNQCVEVFDYSQLVQALLVILAIMLTIIYIQKKKIAKLSAHDEGDGHGH